MVTVLLLHPEFKCLIVILGSMIFIRHRYVCHSGSPFLSATICSNILFSLSFNPAVDYELNTLDFELDVR